MSSLSANEKEREHPMSEAFEFGSGIPTGEAYDTWHWRQVYGALMGMARSYQHSKMLYYEEDGSFGGDWRGTNQLPMPQSLFGAADLASRLQDKYDGLLSRLVQDAQWIFERWQGAGADQFYNVIADLYANIVALRDQVAGREQSYPTWQNFWDIGKNLHHAQAVIQQMDDWYASEAKRLGAPVTANGLVSIASIPSAEQMYNQDASALLHDTVAKGYELAIENVMVLPAESYSTVDPGDKNGDGIADSDQHPSEYDPEGDADSDGFVNSDDHRPWDAYSDTNNDDIDDSDQHPSEYDPGGDADDDGIVNSEDHMPWDAYSDTNNDGIYDSDQHISEYDPDGDADNDGIVNSDDPTPLVGDDVNGDDIPDSDQAESDLFPVGDFESDSADDGPGAFESDSNGDGTPDWEQDLDSDGTIDSDQDANNNGIADGQEDSDGDGIPDAWDPDSVGTTASSFPGTSSHSGGYTEPVLDGNGDPIDGLFAGPDGTVVDSSGDVVAGYSIDDDGRIIDDATGEPLSDAEARVLADAVESDAAGGSSFNPAAPFGGTAALAGTTAALSTPDDLPPVEVLPFGHSEFGPEVWGESGTPALDENGEPVAGLFVGPDGEVVAYGGEEVAGYSIDDDGRIIDDATGQPLTAEDAAQLAGPYTPDPADPGSLVLGPNGNVIPGLTVGPDQSVIGPDGKPYPELSVDEFGTLLGEDGEPLTAEEISAMGLGGYSPAGGGGVNPFETRAVTLPDIEEVDASDFLPGVPYDPDDPAGPDVRSYFGDNGPLNPNGTGGSWVPTGLQSSPIVMPTEPVALSAPGTSVGGLGNLGPLGQAAVTTGTSAPVTSAAPTTAVASAGTPGAAGSPGMPMGGPMGGAGAGGAGGKDGERATWLTEDEDVWSPTSEVSPDVLGS